MNPRPRSADLAVVATLTAAALALGVALHPLAVDDAFVTYRYARNLATGQGFVYNVGRPVLSTTAPLYALLLAAGWRLWPDLPGLANALSAACLGVAALFVYLLGRRERAPVAGALAALLVATHPLLWLSLGLETAFSLALAAMALYAYRGGRLLVTAILLALLTLSRGDGLILAAVIALDSAVRALGPKARSATGTRPLAAAGAYVAVLLPVLLWLTWRFGSPLPATLRAKVAQSALGITGFYPHTTYLQGLGLLVRARLTQTPLYALFVPAVAVGLVVAVRRAPWVRLMALWAAAYLLGYTLLGVTPYYWYYAPLALALACLAGLGVAEATRWAGRHVGEGSVGRPLPGGPWKWLIWAVGGLWAAGLLASFAWSDRAMVRALSGPLPPPADPVSKVLPEAKGAVYRQAGEWLAEQAPADAVVGVTEVGIMGYYARRTMVDFLGLLEPDVAQALARGDLYWALLQYQPDYLALTAVSPLYAYDLRADPWFQAAYTPVQAFEAPRFWGSPLTVYRRQIARVPLGRPEAGGLPEGATRLDVELGHQVRLLGAVTAESAVRPGGVLSLTLYWQALQPLSADYAVFVHLLGQYDRVLAQRDATPGLGARPTSGWTPGAVVADPHLVAVPEAAYAPDRAVWEVGLYEAQTGVRLQAADGRDNVRFGAVSLEPAPGPLHLDFGPIALTGYELDRLALKPGETLGVTLRWSGGGPAWVTVELWGEGGELAAMAEGSSAGPGRYELAVGTGVAPGAYDLTVSAYDPADGHRLPLLGADGQPRGDRAVLTKVRLYP